MTKSKEGWYYRQSGVGVVSPSERRSPTRSGITIRVTKSKEEWYYRQSGVGVVSPSEWGRSGITVRETKSKEEWYYRQSGVGVIQSGSSAPVTSTHNPVVPLAVKTIRKTKQTKRAVQVVSYV